MPGPLFYAEIVIRQTPLWAWLVLALLCVIGVRRLRTRPTSVWGLVITPTVFLCWSLIGAVSFGQAFGLLVAMAAWIACIAVGLVSFRLVGPPQTKWIDERRVVRPGSYGSLIVYLSVFAFRYGLEVWAGFFPERAGLADALALIVSGYMAGRTAGDLWSALRARPAAFGAR